MHIHYIKFIYTFFFLSLHKLVSGLGLGVCRHGNVLICNDVYVGERYVYAALTLTHVTNERKVGVFLYDVACRFQSFFRAWLMSLKDEECYGFSIAKRQHILDSVLNVLPPMHVNGHA